MIRRVDPDAHRRAHNGRLAAARRARNTAAGSCINETLHLNHGPATHGVRCEACSITHRRSA